MATYDDFFYDVLTGLGVTPSAGSLQGIADVVNEEGRNSYFNPFNIEWHSGNDTAYKGVANFNSVGVQEYGSYDQGVAATVAFIKDNWGSSFVDALKSGDKGTIDSAFTSIYTWAPFRTTTTSGDESILASSIGKGTGGATLPGTGSNTPIPFDPSTLKVPLTSQQRTLMLDYIESWFDKNNQVAAANAIFLHDFSASAAVTELAQIHSGQADTQLLSAYKQFAAKSPIVPGGYDGDVKQSYAGPGAGVLSWTHYLATAGAWLTSVKNWERIGMWVLGGLIVLVVVIEIFKPDSTPVPIPV